VATDTGAAHRAEAERAGPQRSPRRARAVWIVWGLTRVLLVILALRPDVYNGLSGETVANDVNLYDRYAEEILAGEEPYADVGVEYPPGILPVVVLPALLPGVSYAQGYVGLMVAFDAVALAVLLRLRGRWGSALGAWFWVACAVLLGPLWLVRLDLVPAVAVLLAVERLAAGRAAAGGAWFAVGAVTKLYPAALALPALLAASRRLRFVTGGLTVGLLAVAPFATTLSDLLRSVFGYHTARGLQLESTWSSLLLVLDPRTLVDFNFGAFHVAAGGAPAMETASSVLTIGAVAVGAGLASARLGRDDVAGLAQVLAATTALLLGVASVFSPQYMIWGVGAASAALAIRNTRLRAPLLLLAPATLLSQAVYPFLYSRLIDVETASVWVLAIRNTLVVVAGAWAAGVLLSRQRRDWEHRGRPAPAAAPISDA